MIGSRSWWWTGKPSVVQSMQLLRVGHNWVTELNWNYVLPSYYLFFCHFCGSSLFISFFAFPIVVWWFSLVICLIYFIFIFCVSFVSFFSVVTMGFMYVDPKLYLLNLNWKAFKFKCVLEDLHFFLSSPIFWFWSQILHVNVYPLTI